LGVECLGKKAPEGVDTALTFVARYTGSNFVATSNLGLNGTLQASYFQKVYFIFLSFSFFLCYLFSFSFSFFFVLKKKKIKFKIQNSYKK